MILGVVIFVETLLPTRKNATCCTLEFLDIPQLLMPTPDYIPR